jgi:hypothetical protein
MSRTTTEMPLSTNSLNFVGFKAITDRTDGSPTYTACTAGSTFGTSSTYHKCCGTVEPCSFATTCIENIYATLIYEAPDGSSSINRWWVFPVSTEIQERNLAFNPCSTSSFNLDQ